MISRFRLATALLLTLGAAWSVAPAQAAVVGIPLNALGAPAVDLQDHGRPLDRDELIDRAARGEDISLLDPVPSDAWRGTPLSATDFAPWQYPAEASTLTFESTPEKSPRLIFRARVSTGQDPGARSFQLTLSPREHAALSTAALLRKLGYPVPSPRHYRELTLRFDSIEQRDRVLESVFTRTTMVSAHWEIERPKDAPWVRLKDVLLEPAQIDFWPFHWGLMTESLLGGRRALRALLVAQLLTDIPENVNLYPFSVGRILSETLVLAHPYADAYREASRDDLRWVARKIAALSRADLVEVVAAGRYPADISLLLVERLVARQKHLASIFDVSPPGADYRYEPRITAGAVHRGKATQADYEGYAISFSAEDPRNPLTRNELMRFLEIEAVNAGLQKLTDTINSALTLQSTTEQMNHHLRDLQKRCLAELQAGKPFCTRPVGVWGGLAGGLRIQADRSVVTGSYYIGDSRVQLVDKIGASASLGYFASRDGLPQIGRFHERIGPTPLMGGDYTRLSVNRDYVHVRPLVSLKQAQKESWEHLDVPAFMKKLARSLDPELALSPAPGKGLPSELLEDLKVGESFIITDSISFGSELQGTAPLANVLNLAVMGYGPTVGLAVDGQTAILKRTTITRAPNGFQVYLQRMNRNALDWSVALSFSFDVAKLSHADKNGVAATKAFLLGDTPDARTPEGQGERRKLAVALHGLLDSNSSEFLESEFGHYGLQHALTARINRARLLALQWFGLEESHLLRIRPPGGPDGHVAPDREFERQLFSHRIVRTRGANYSALLNDVISGLSTGLRPLPEAGENPANSPGGLSAWATWSSEAELTASQELRPVAIAQHHWNGWSMSRHEFLHVLDGIEAKIRPLNLQKPIFRRDEFKDMSRIQFYDIVSKLVIAPEGLQRLMDRFFPLGGSTDDTIQAMIETEGREDYNRWCRSREMGLPFGETEGDHWMPEASWRDPRSTEASPRERCIKPWMRALLDLQSRTQDGVQAGKAKERVVFNARLLRALETTLPFEKFLSLLGRENWFFSAKVSGFRAGDPRGETDEVSDTVGTLNPREGTGPFSELGALLGISTQELQGRYLSDGF